MNRSKRREPSPLSGTLLLWLKCFALCCALICASTNGFIAAQELTPSTPTLPLRVPAELNQLPSSPASSTTQQPLALPPLKAVLIVGPIDGDYGSWTTAEKTNMDLAAAELAANGVTVRKFYTPDNDWNQIKAAAQGAHFLFYRGHGVYWSPMPTPIVGGFALKDKFVSSDDIRSDLHLAPNAIVMLYGCFSAGTAGNDITSITSAEAQRRVAMYSDPFLDIGAAGYYADWFGDAFQMFVRHLFQGRTLGQTYESFYDFNGATVERYAHPDHPQLAMWLDKDFWDGKTQYNDAFAGSPYLRLTDLFQLKHMAVTPAELTYLTTRTGPTRSFQIWVRSPEAPLHWQASLAPQSPGWVTLKASGGNSAQPIVLTLTPGNRALGTYAAQLHIVSDTPGVQNNDQTIRVTMHLAPRLYTVHLPPALR